MEKIYRKKWTEGQRKKCKCETVRCCSDSVHYGFPPLDIIAHILYLSSPDFSWEKECHSTPCIRQVSPDVARLPTEDRILNDASSRGRKHITKRERDGACVSRRQRTDENGTHIELDSLASDGFPPFDIVTTILSLLNKDSPLNDALSHGRTKITKCRRTEAY